MALACLFALSGPATSSSPTPSPVSVLITRSGKSVRYSIPSTVVGGLVQLTVTNKDTRARHTLQLARIIGNHTAKQAVRVIHGLGSETPTWLRAEGGVGWIPTRKTERGTINLVAGNYVATGLAGERPSGYATFVVAGGVTGSLPTTAKTITAAQTGKNRYGWRVRGALKRGANRVTFNSKGKNAVHLIVAVRITGNPSRAQIISGLSLNRAPRFFDLRSLSNTAVLDGGRSQVTPVNLSRSGRYVLFCPLSNRRGGTPFFRQGLLTMIRVK